MTSAERFLAGSLGFVSEGNHLRRTPTMAGVLLLSGDVQNLFSAHSYGWIVNGWGGNTQPPTVYSVVNSVDSGYVFSVFLYKGHSYPVDCTVQGCLFEHYGVYDNEGPEPQDNCIKDYLIHEQLSTYSHKLVICFPGEGAQLPEGCWTAGP